jgi:hypothetical protein
MMWLLAALVVTGCGARTDLGAPRPISGQTPDSGGTPPPTISCVATHKTALSHGTTSDFDVRIDGAYVYWNDGAHIVRVPKSGSPTPEVVVDAVVDPGGFDLDDAGQVVYAEHGSAQVRRSNGTLVGSVSRPGIELVAVSSKRTYVIAPQAKSEGLFTIDDKGTALVAILPLTATDSLGQGQFPQAAYDLVIDDADAFAFVSLIGQAPLPSKVLSVAIDTGNVTTLSQMPLSLPGSALALGDKYVYYASSFGQDAPAIFAVPRSGGEAPHAVVPTQTYCASCSRTMLSSTKDKDSIFFSAGEFGQNVASWKPSDDELPIYVSETQAQVAVTGLRSDGSCVYWTAASDPNVYVAPVLQ